MINNVKNEGNFRRTFPPRKRPIPFRKNDNLKVCTLSGVEEVGRNSNFVEIGNEIIMIDCGFSFPELELYGVDYLIPNFAYLKKNKKKIKGILITHGHLDHTGALPYILPELGYPPIYAGRFANALIKNRLKEFEMDNKVKFIDIHRNTVMHLGQFKISFIGVTHSIPDSHSIFIETRKGNVFFSGDYKIDMAPANEPQTDYTKLKSLAGRVDLAFMESTNSFESGKTKSEKEISQNLEETIRKCEGRVVVASFSSLLSRLYSVLQIAQKTNRKVVLLGRSLKTVVEIAREQRYINIPDKMIIPEQKIKNFSDKELLIISTGSQGEKYAALNRISTGEHKYFKVKKGDFIILSASEIPGNFIQIQQMTDRLIKLGAEILKESMEDIYESGHGFQEDMKMMYEMIRPKNIVPIHGNMTLRYQNKKNFIKWGFPEDRIYLTDDGQIWELDGSKVIKGNTIDAKPILIDGLGIGDVGETVLKDRQQLAEYGMFIVLLNLSENSKKILGRPKFISRGFVYMKTSQGLIKEAENVIYDVHREWSYKNSNDQNYQELKELLEKQLRNFLYKKTEREPAIIVAII